MSPRTERGDAPGVAMMSLEQLRESVRRELAALFSTTSLEVIDASLPHHPQARRSTLNFGMPDLAGKTASAVNLQQLERHLARVIREFEPRVSADSLRVRSIDEHGRRHNTLAFEIEGELWSQPLPQKLLLRTELDLESGQVRVEDSRG